MTSPGNYQSWILRHGHKASAPVMGLALAIACIWVLAAAPAAHAQTYQVIHNFAGGLDGSEPDAGPTLDAAGNLYGTTFEGDAGTGTAYKLSHAKGGWVSSPLYMFTGYADGGIPYARPIFGPDGSLYGTTGYGGMGMCGTPWGGRSGCGVVYNLKPPPRPPTTPLTFWNETVVYRFTGGSDGANPYGADVIFDKSGNLYGTTYNGGAGCDTGCGVVYKLTPTTTGSWSETVLYTFTNGVDGAHPWGGVIFDQAGNLYGTTVYGGASQQGTVYKLTPNGSGWTQTTLYSFTGGNDGGLPYAGLIWDTAGNLYGATTVGGSGSGGTVFELSPSGGGWSLSTLYSFIGSGGQFLSGPVAALAMDSAGNLYGTTHTDGPYHYGAAFELTLSSGSWSYISLHDFTGGTDGGYPRTTPVFDKNGNLYGTAAMGGTGDPQNCVGPCGVIFQIAP